MLVRPLALQGFFAGPLLNSCEVNDPSLEKDDKGLNPDLYTKHRLKLADDLNQHNQGRVESLRLLHDHVQREVERRLGPAPVVKRIDPGATAGSDAMQVDGAADCSR